MPEDAEGELLMTPKCPEFSTRSAFGGVATPRGEDSETGRRRETETNRHKTIGNELGTQSGKAPPRTHAVSTPPGGLYRPAAVRLYAARRWKWRDQGNVPNRGVNSFRKILEANS